MTVGGNLVEYPGEVVTKRTVLATAKLLLNQIISKPSALNIKDFYLNNDLPTTIYIHIPVNIIPDDIIYQQDKLHQFEPNGYIYAAVDKGMYGLRQAGRVASNVLIPRLKEARNRPCNQ